MVGDSSVVPAPAEEVPGEFAVLDAAGRSALAVVGAAGGWHARTRAEVLALVQRHKGVLAAIEARLVTAERDAGTWALKGDRDLAGFLGRVSRQGRDAGSVAAGQAATLAALPAVADALVDGPVTERHVAEIARASASSPRLAEQLATAAGQARLVDMARRLDAKEFGKHLKSMGAAVDPVGRQREHEAQRRERFLHLTVGPHGTHLKGYLDTVAGHRLSKAIEALDPLPAADDDRSAAQRRADALATMAESVLRDPTTTPGSVAPAQVVLTIGEETWAALRAAREAPAEVASAAGADGVGEDSSGAGADATRGSTNVSSEPGKGSTLVVAGAMRGHAAVLDEDGTPWPAGEVARLLCECELTRAVISADNQLLQLGKGVRRFDRRFFTALLATGWRTCAWPGCTMPLRWAQLHHLDWWQRDDGTTNWNNCGPYCCYHHQYIHDHDIRVRRLADGSYEHRRPDGALVGVGRPRRGEQPPNAGPAPGSGASSGSPPGPDGSRPSDGSAPEPVARRGVVRPPGGDGRAGQPDGEGRAEQPALWTR